MAETLYQKRQAAKRKTRDIDRLRQDFSRQLEQYNVQTGAKLADYEQKVAQYDAAYGSYESRFNDYQRASNEFNARVLAYQGRVAQYNEALDKYLTKTVVGTANQNYGNWWYYGGNPGAAAQPVGNSYVLKTGYEFVPTSFQKGGMSGNIVQRGGPDPGEFTEKFEEKFTMQAPEAPAQPEALDVSAEKAKIEEERSIMEREIGEREKARVRAVQRGQQRPMLSSGTTLKPKA